MFDQSAYRLEAVEQMIAYLQTAIQSRYCEINLLKSRLAESRAHYTAFHEILSTYYRQLQEATVATCNGGDKPFV